MVLSSRVVLRVVITEEVALRMLAFVFLFGLDRTVPHQLLGV